MCLINFEDFLNIALHGFLLYNKNVSCRRHPTVRLRNPRKALKTLHRERERERERERNGASCRERNMAQKGRERGSF